MKRPVLQTEMLWDVFNGVYKVTTYYDDGTSEEQFIPKGKVIIQDPMIFYSHWSSPEEFPEEKSINCFHPKIANFVIKVLKWFSNVRKSK